MNKYATSFGLGLVVVLCAASLYGVTQWYPSNCQDCLNAHMSPPPEWQNVVTDVEKYTRAGASTKLEAAVAKLCKIQPAPDTGRICSAVATLVEHREYNLAQNLMYHFPRATAAAGNDLVKHRAAESATSSSARSQTVAFLRHGAKQNRSFYWPLHKVFGDQLQDHTELFDDMKAYLQRNPADMESVVLYLDVARGAYDQPETEWMTRVILPPLATQNSRLATALQGQWPEQALFYLRRADSLPITNSDIKALQKSELQISYKSIPVQPGEEVKTFKYWIRALLINNLTLGGKADEAKALQQIWASRPMLENSH